MTKTFCDKCGNDVEMNLFKIEVHTPTGTSNGIRKYITETAELCENCAFELKKFLTL